CRGRFERLARAEPHRGALRVDPDDVGALAERHAEVLALTEREGVDAAVRADHAPRSIDDGPRAQSIGGVLLDERVVPPVRHEAKLLALALVRTGQLEGARLVAHGAL